MAFHPAASFLKYGVLLPKRYPAIGTDSHDMAVVAALHCSCSPFTDGACEGALPPRFASFHRSIHKGAFLLHSGREPVFFIFHDAPFLITRNPTA